MSADITSLQHDLIAAAEIVACHGTSSSTSQDMQRFTEADRWLRNFGMSSNQSSSSSSSSATSSSTVWATCLPLVAHPSVSVQFIVASILKHQVANQWYIDNLQRVEESSKHVRADTHTHTSIPPYLPRHALTQQEQAYIIEQLVQVINLHDGSRASHAISDVALRSLCLSLARAGT
jgi:hypothetical protein